MRLWQCMILVFVVTCAADAGDDWVKKSPPGDLPSARFGHALAYIGDDKVLAFGGNTSPVPYANDTWLYDLSDSTWTNLNPSEPVPSIRRDHAMAYIGGDQVLLFGGYYPGYLGETWVYTLSTNTWRQLFPSSPPPPRYSHAMCYVGEDRVILHGGIDSTFYSGRLWLFDLSDESWTELHPSGSKPSGRHYHDLARIRETGVLLFGGYDAVSIKNDTWLYDVSLNAWTEFTPSGTLPSRRYMHSMVSIGGNKVMMFGGKTGSSGNDETWVFDLSDTTWIMDVNVLHPGRLYQHKLAQTSLDGTRYIVLFGGASSQGENNDTWTFGGGDYIVSVDPGTAPLPAAARVEQNYPNPFNPTTLIRYHVPAISHVRLVVYDLLGRELAVLVDTRVEAGNHEMKFDASGLSSGVYLYRLTAGSFVQTRRMILVR